jgi:hypothetical protein
MPPRCLRLLTTLLVLGLCGFAVSRGWSVVRFAEARSSGGDAVRAWIGAPGLTTAALRASLGRAFAAGDVGMVRQRADDLAALIAVRPLSATSWLSLAGMWLVEGEPHDKVLAALRMSWVTGPNEDRLVWDRGVFGLLEWDFLSPDARQRTIRDLAGALTGSVVEDWQIAALEKALLRRSDVFRREIGRGLLSAGAPAAALSRLGL